MNIFQSCLNDYGIREVRGEQNNPRIMEYFSVFKNHSWVQGDETAWCSAFVNYHNKVNGYNYSGKPTARSWLNIGRILRPHEIWMPGDVVILWRESLDSWKGHAGYPVVMRGQWIWIFGGNQRNQVNISAFPIRRILGVVRP